MKARVAILVVLIAGAVATMAAATTRTHTVVYHAFTTSGKPALRIAKTLSGSCNGGSSAINRSDAWRCFGGNFVLDPCFSSSHATGIVLCPGNPWRKSLIEVKVGNLTLGNTHRPSTNGLPWAIETVSGLKCVIATGATTVVGGLRANYFCKNSVSLWGNPSRNTEPWTIGVGKTKSTRNTQVKTAWF